MQHTLTQENWLLENGYLNIATQKSSPWQDQRPTDAIIDTVIMHCISIPRGIYGIDYVSQLFTNKWDRLSEQSPILPEIDNLHGLAVSSHFYIRRAGTVFQYVPTHQRAWHAGISSLNGKANCNNYSIGIELEGTDDSPFEAIQYDCLAKLLATLKKNYPAIQARNIVRHSDVAPSRKTDPGQHFDLNQVREQFEKMSC